MAPLPFVPGLCRVVIKGSLVSSKWANVFHVMKNDNLPWADNQLGSLAAAFRPAYTDNFKVLMVAASIIGDITCTDLSSDTGGEASLPGATPGTGAGTSSAANVATGITWRINRRYRGGHPRTYLPGVPSGVISDPTTFTSGHVAAALAGAQAFRNTVNAIVFGAVTMNLVCVHYRRNNQQLAVPLISQIQGASVDSRPDSQRRRLGRDR